MEEKPRKRDYVLTVNEQFIQRIMSPRIITIFPAQYLELTNNKRPGREGPAVRNPRK